MLLAGSWADTAIKHLFDNEAGHAYPAVCRFGKHAGAWKGAEHANAAVVVGGTCLDHIENLPCRGFRGVTYVRATTPEEDIHVCLNLRDASAV